MKKSVLFMALMAVTMTAGAQRNDLYSTGKSTGPHVHYEVWVGNKDVNPINYYFMDLDAEQYEEMVNLAENHGKVFD